MRRLRAVSLELQLSATVKKKIIKTFKWHLLFQSESLAHVPVEVITFQIHTGADGNVVMAQ